MRDHWYKLLLSRRFHVYQSLVTEVWVLNPHVLRVLHMLIDEAWVVDSGACNGKVTAFFMLHRNWLSQVMQVK